LDDLTTRWVVRFECHEQRDGYYSTYELIGDLREINAPSNCRKITLIRTGAEQVAQAIFERFSQREDEVSDKPK
jgi:hypothetical protein